MNMTQTFHTVRKLPPREAEVSNELGIRSEHGEAQGMENVYVEQHVKMHPLWRNMQFWEIAFFGLCILSLCRFASCVRGL